LPDTALQTVAARAPSPGPILAPPYFDIDGLRAELSALNVALGEDERPLRAAILKRLKELGATARLHAERQLTVDGDGRACAKGLSVFQDHLIRLIYDFATAHLYPANVPSDAERMCVVATGGYGRGLLAPGSDIDLLFLLPYKQTAWGESVVEYVLMLLWDLGYKVGHATRTIEQCLSLAREDLTIRTALLDARAVLGDAALFDDLVRRFRADVKGSDGRAFIEAKIAERDERSRKAGGSRYLVEPNLKDGKGGLRDLHTLHWVIKYLHGSGPRDLTEETGVLTAREARTFSRCAEFLWTVRCHLHFLTGRAEDRLTFDVQRAVAERLHYTSRAGMSGVERFMKHYFLVARDVGQLMTTVCAGLEMQQLKAAPALNRLLSPLTWRLRRRLRDTSDFKIETGRITVTAPDVFKRDPVNLIRLFARAESLNVPFHPDALRLVRHSLGLIDDTLRNDAQANQIFLGLVTSKQNPESALRHMNESGVLGRFVPEFGRVVSMMQFNMYHHYTVDEHLLRTVGQVYAIENGAASEDLPLSTTIIKTIQGRQALYVAAFLHDIGKGRPEDHSILGAEIARKLCPRFGLSAAETETVVWLIEQHLVMSNTAQSRDISDPKTIADFAKIVQSPERLKLLLLLTVADIRAVGPGTWNGWKGQLLRSLYYETEPVIAGGHATVGHKQRVAQAQDELRRQLADWPAGEADRSIARHYDDYWLKTDPKRLAEHARFLKEAEAAGQSLATQFRTDAFMQVTELTVLAPNHPRLLAIFAGACAAAGANIVGAHVSTTRDGLALDTFLLQREFTDEHDEKRRAQRIGQTIEKLLKGEIWFDTLLAKRREMKGRVKAFSVVPEVVIDNTTSEKLTVLEVSGIDRPGLLHDLTSAISDLNLDIGSAHITTFGEKAVDVFYVTDLTGRKVTGEQRQKTVRARLMSVLAEPAPEAAPET
jgi:[protein-PII] uridylyltransferase